MNESTWRAAKTDAANLFHDDGDWAVIADLPSRQGGETAVACYLTRKNAQRIVRAVSMHDELLAALRIALSALQMARENVAAIGGENCDEAKYFDEPIRAVAKAIARAAKGESS